MKIAFATSGAGLDAKIEDRLGQAKNLIIVDLDTEGYEFLEIPFKHGKRGLGINIALLAMEKGSKAIVAGYISPRIGNTLSKEGLKVIEYKECSIRDFLDALNRGEIQDLTYSALSPKNSREKITSLATEIRRTAGQFFNIFPVLAGVVLIIGFIRSFLKQDLLLILFRGRPLPDSILGAFAGSIFTGTPMNSYLIGDMLLKMGMSAFAVSALLMTWVSVGLAQLPLEIAALGRSFALKRIVISFIMSVIMALILGILMGILN